MLFYFFKLLVYNAGNLLRNIHHLVSSEGRAQTRVFYDYLVTVTWDLDYGIVEFMSFPCTINPKEAVISKDKIIYNYCSNFRITKMILQKAPND